METLVQGLVFYQLHKYVSNPLFSGPKSEICWPASLEMMNFCPEIEKYGNFWPENDKNMHFLARKLW